MSEKKETLTVRLEGSEKMRKWLMRLVVGFLVLVFMGGMVWGADDLLGREGTWPPQQELDETITDPPTGRQGVYDYVCLSIGDVLEYQPKTRVSTNFELDKDSIAFTGEGADAAKAARLTELAKMLAPDVLDRLNGAIPEQVTQYEDDLCDLIWSVECSPQALDEEGTACDFIYYKCKVCGKDKDEPLEVCPDCEAEDSPYEIRYRGDYTVTMKFPDGAPEIEALFHPRTAEQAMALLGGGLEGFAQVKYTPVPYTNARIVMCVDRMYRKIKWMRFQRDINVTMDMVVDQALEDITTQMSCVLSETTEFSFTWMGAVLNKREVTLGKRETVQLAGRANAPLEQETPMLWETDSPEICTVDRDGLVRAGKAYGQAQIYVSFDHGEDTYADVCLVSVKVPVDKIRLNKRKLKLEPGETMQLKAAVSPRKATNKDVTWETDDTAVVTVKDGLVTAVAPGVAIVRAVTVDGYFVSSCNITVGGEMNG